MNNADFTAQTFKPPTLFFCFPTRSLVGACFAFTWGYYSLSGIPSLTHTFIQRKICCPIFQRYRKKKVAMCAKTQNLVYWNVFSLAKQKKFSCWSECWCNSFLESTAALPPLLLCLYLVCKISVWARFGCPPPYPKTIHWRPCSYRPGGTRVLFLVLSQPTLLKQKWEKADMALKRKGCFNIQHTSLKKMLNFCPQIIWSW